MRFKENRSHNNRDVSEIGARRKLGVCRNHQHNSPATRPHLLPRSWAFRPNEPSTIVSVANQSPTPSAKLLTGSAMSIQSITIPTTTTRPNPKPHTAYKIVISTPVRTWDVWRRYSDFESLAAELKSEAGKEVDGEGLPGKHPWSFRSSVNDVKVCHLIAKSIPTPVLLET